MLKKIASLSIISFSLISIASAGNFYVGPSLSYDSISSNSYRYQGISPMVSFGYGDLFRDTFFYYAGEIFAAPKYFQNYNRTINNLNLKILYSYGASFLPGYYFDNSTLGYLRLGAEWTRFDTLNITRCGFETGIGLQANINERWSIRGEFNYIRYSQISFIGYPSMEEFDLGAVYALG